MAAEPFVKRLGRRLGTRDCEGQCRRNCAERAERRSRCEGEDCMSHKCWVFRRVAERGTRSQKGLCSTRAKGPLSIASPTVREICDGVFPTIEHTRCRELPIIRDGTHEFSSNRPINKAR